MQVPIKKKYFHDVLGMRIYTCCKPCLEKVRKEPREALRLLTMVGQYPEFIDTKDPKITRDKNESLRVTKAILYSCCGLFIAGAFLFGKKYLKRD